ncbi:hypothetical protein [Phreatobacter sp.]|uniref:hypothetical protein n=1 Tax=Phreatobacter sp. TaxID=1966341 RepID=UPI003F71E960
MRLPQQARPVGRSTSTTLSIDGVRPSCCPGGETCIGKCVFGRCLGYCLPIPL